MSNNPLAKFYRVPKIYTSLPTKGVFYDPGEVETAVNGEVAIYAMSAVDEMLLRTPDALLNGDSLLKVIKNCVPGVANPKNLVEPDINTLLLAIRIASNGPGMSIDLQCPNCQHDNTFEINLQNILDTQSFLDDECVIEMDNELLIRVRPYNFEQRHLQILNEIQQQQTIQQLQSQNDDDFDKVAKIAEAIDRMAIRTFDIISKSIESVHIVATGETVVDQQHISEFMTGISKHQSDIIMNKIKDLNQTGIETNISFCCNKCQHTWDQQVDFDQSSFFG